MGECCHSTNSWNRSVHRCTGMRTTLSSHHNSRAILTKRVMLEAPIGTAVQANVYRAPDDKSPVKFRLDREDVTRTRAQPQEGLTCFTLEMEGQVQVEKVIEELDRYPAFRVLADGDPQVRPKSPDQPHAPYATCIHHRLTFRQRIRSTSHKMNTQEKMRMDLQSCKLAGKELLALGS